MAAAVMTATAMRMEVREQGYGTRTVGHRHDSILTCVCVWSMGRDRGDDDIR